MRRFEKISFEQFKKDISDDRELYDEYLLPKRETRKAAAYDFYALFDYVLKPGEIKKIPTGVKVIMEDNDCLNEIRQGLEQKLDSMVRHELYAKYKTALTQEDREKARQEYLDKRGVWDSFRW